MQSESVLTTTYCSPEDVAEVMDLPDHMDPTGTLMFTNESHPTYERVQKMILSAEDEIDRRTRRSWRENRVVNQQLTINSYWHDTNGWRSDYYAEGGDFVQLRKNVRPWDPSKGDRLEIRMRNNSWADVTQYIRPMPVPPNEGEEEEPPTPPEPPIVQHECPKCGYVTYDPTCPKCGWAYGESTVPDYEEYFYAYFDYPYGKLYLRTRYFQQRYNALRISYRYGAEEDVPWGINRLCSLIVASHIINMSVFNIKVGTGSDISGVRDQLLANWNDEIGRLYTSFQRSGSVHGALR